MTPRGSSALACGLILALAGGVAALTFMTEPTAKRGGATKQTAMLVEVAPAERGTFRPTIVATGTVQAEQDVVLSPQVAGVVLQHAPELVPGGYVDKGQLLVRLEAADYKNALQQRQSELQQAKADLRLEMGRQHVAQRDYELFGDELPSAQQELMLREPQLEAARVRVEAAQAAIDQAKLESSSSRPPTRRIT